MTDRNEPKLIEEVVYDSSDAEFDDDEETISIPAATKVVSSRKNDDLPNTSLENGQYNTNVIVLLERVKVPNSQGLEWKVRYSFYLIPSQTQTFQLCINILTSLINKFAIAALM